MQILGIVLVALGLFFGYRLWQIIKGEIPNVNMLASALSFVMVFYGIPVGITIIVQS